MRRFIVISVAVAIAALVLIRMFMPGWLGIGGAVTTAGRSSAPVVEAMSVTKARFADTIEAVGTALASESVTITAKTADTVGAINFTEGQDVAKGDILLEMTSTAQSADLAAARAQLSEAQRAYERAADLVAKGIAARAALDSATADRDAARARVQAIEAKLTDTIIKAPFAGVVGLRNVSVGSFVRPGDIITTLDAIDVIKGDFTVAERFITLLKPGQTIHAEVAAYPGEAFAGKVASVDTRVDPATRSVKVRAELPNDGRKLKPGMLMSVMLTVGEHDGLSVPESAIVAQGGKRFVFRIGAENKAERVEVVTGLVLPGTVEIISGLNEGDRVISGGVNKVRPGQPVEIDGAAAKGNPG